MWFVLVLAVALFLSGGTVNANECGFTISDAEISPGSTDDLQVRGFFTKNVSSTIKATKTERVTLVNSPGGYVSAAREVARTVKRVEIGGIACTSACAVILVESDNVCLLPTVQVITFHTIIKQYCVDGEIKIEVQEASTQEFVNSINRPLRDQLLHLPTGNYYHDVQVDDFLLSYPNKMCIL